MTENGPLAVTEAAFRYELEAEREHHAGIALSADFFRGETMLARNPLRLEVLMEFEHQRETRLNWSFAAAGPGLKRVILSFTIPNALTNGSSNENRFEAEWAGVFKVPVNKAVYRFVFPDNSERHVSSTPAEYTVKERNGCRSIEMTQAPFHNSNFEITFWPRVADAGVSLASLGRSTSKARSWLAHQFDHLVIWGVIIIFVLAISAIKRGKRARRSSDSSWWSSGSSCAGGSSSSSCSSSCGSSCGGGCGGGCGG